MPNDFSLESVNTGFVMWLGGITALSIFCWLMLHDQWNILLSLCLVATFIVIAVVSKAAAAMLVMGFLTLMGDLRRIETSLFGDSAFDLLLLVGPIMAVYLTAPVLLRLRLHDPLSKAILFLTFIMLVEIFNPQQGGLAVGASGAIFYIAPVLWFWFGREYASPAIVEKLVYWVVLPLSLLGAILGLCQTYIGFLPYEQSWIDAVSKQYVILHVGNATRAFGFSISAAEYATILGMGAAASAAALLTKKKIWGLAFPILIAALILASSRSVVLKLILALSVVWILRRGQKLGTLAILRLGVAVVVGLGLVIFAASQFAGGDVATRGKTSAVNSLIAHQANGFAHPLDEKYSTAGIHSQMVIIGLYAGFAHPAGYGLGTTTPAGAKFGSNADIGSSEVDISDMFICLGFIGGFLYLYIVVAAMRKALTYVNTVRLSTSLPVVAILTLSLAAWLIAGQYSTSSIVFFLVGALAHSENRLAKGAVIVRSSPRSIQPIAGLVTERISSSI